MCMEPGHAPPGGDGGEENPSSSAAATAASSTTDATSHPPLPLSSPQQPPPAAPQHQQLSRYESQKKRDWNAFLQYLKNHKPPLSLARCSGAHVIEFLKYLDQFGKTKVHGDGCAHFGVLNPPASCECPLKQAWGSLDALIGRLRAAHDENGGRQESNPFGAKAVRIYLREVRTSQAKARGIPYEKKKRKRPPSSTAPIVADTPAVGGKGSSGGSGEPSSAHPTAPEVAAVTAGDAGGDGGYTSSHVTGEGTDVPPTRLEFLTNN